MAAMLLAGQAWLTSHGWSHAQGRSVVFGALVVGVMLLIWANRDLSRPAWFAITDRNPWLWRMAGGMGLLLVAVLGIPWLRTLMGLELPGSQGFIVAAVLITLCLAWLELVRKVGQRWRRTRG